MIAQCHRLVEYLEEHDSIDPLTAWQELGIYRLAARVHEARSEGHQIESRRTKVTNRFGENARIAVYSLRRPDGR